MNILHSVLSFGALFLNIFVFHNFAMSTMTATTKEYDPFSDKDAHDQEGHEGEGEDGDDGGDDVSFWNFVRQRPFHFRCKTRRVSGLI